MRGIFIIAALATVAASCHTTPTPIYVGGRNAANDGGGVAVGAQASGTAQPEVSDICDVSSLEAQHDTYERRVARLRVEATGDAAAASEGERGRSAARSGGASASAGGDERSTASVEGSERESEYHEATMRVISRINSFDAEIDGKYRAVTSSCRAFSRCMQNNYYDEGQCRSTLARWERADQDYSDLARELREIEAEVERTRIIARSKKGGGKHKDKYRVNQYEKCDCSRSVGGVFANCCDRREGRY